MATPTLFKTIPQKTGSLVVMVVISLSLFARTAHAQFVPTNDAMLNAQKAVDIGKELGLDGLLNLAAQAAIDQLTSTIVNQIRGGYDGNPMYITDLEGYLYSIDQQVNNDYAQGIRAADTCYTNASGGEWVDPSTGQPVDTNDLWSERVAASLENGSGALSDTRTQQVADRYSCPFVNGQPRTLAQDGWDAFLTQMTDPGGNDFSRRAILGEDLAVQRRIAREREMSYAQWNDGYLGNQDCSSGRCVTTTPGSVTRSQLDWSLTSGLRKLELADEVDEMITAVMNAAVERLFNEAEGLFSTAMDDFGATTLSQRVGAEQAIRNNMDNLERTIQGSLNQPR